MTLDHLDAIDFGALDHGLPGNAVEEAVRGRGVQRTILDEENVGTRALSDVAAPVEHDRVVEALRLGLVLGDSTDHVQPRRLGVDRCTLGRGPLVLCPLQLDPGHAGFGVEVGAHVPANDRDVGRGLLGRDRHHFRPAPGDRADVSVGKALRLERGVGRVIEFLVGIADVHAEDFGRLEQPVGVFLVLEYLAPVGALALEHAGPVVQPVREDVQPPFIPIDHFTVVPELAAKLIEGNASHTEDSTLAGAPPSAPLSRITGGWIYVNSPDIFCRA